MPHRSHSHARAIDPKKTTIYLVGGGIASLASAVFFIRDGGVAGANIHIFEESPIVGGSLDAGGTPETGYMLRGARIFEEHYDRTFELLASVPSLGDPAKSVRDEIEDFNRRVKTEARCRLVENGERTPFSHLGLSWRDRFNLAELMMLPEDALAGHAIDTFFEPAFFRSNFWLFYSTTFAFEPWHSAAELKRYLVRFLHLFPGLRDLSAVKRTPYNQYDSVVRPTVEWLRKEGVHLDTNVKVTDIDFRTDDSGRSVERLHLVRNGKPCVITVFDGDRVVVTLGSMTACSTFGSMAEPPKLAPKEATGAWPLWEKIASKATDFGRPSAFDSHVEKSQFVSFTMTFRDPVFVERMTAFSGNAPGTGGLVTLKDSNWLLSVVVPKQPHFIGQPEGVDVAWGYGLFPGALGNFVPKKMSDCSGGEILTELVGHLGPRFQDVTKQLLATSTCIPCMMPYVTSQFLPRQEGDRPAVLPRGARNFAFVGQYCEIPDDCVFTVEYSVRAAEMAVSGLLGQDREVPPVHAAEREPRAVFQAIRTVLE